MKILVAVLIAMVSMNVWSADVKLEKAKELMKTMQITKHIDSSFQQIIKFSEQMIESQDLTQEQAKQAKDMAKRSMEISFNRMKSIDWETIFSEVYAKVFTAEELQDLISFYKSPLGQKVLNKQPELMQATMKRMQVEMVKIMPEIQQDIKKAIEEAKKQQVDSK